MTFIMTFLMFFCALALSASAAWYSIVGLTAIFAAARVPIIIMGATLEVSKLVIASWLYRNWKEVPILMKSYLTIALLVLMFLTSMGIFGFLSKASNDQTVVSGEVVAKIQFIERKIDLEQSKIDSARKALTQLDSQVNEMIGRSTNTSAINRSVTIRRQQDKERARLSTEIESAQAKIGQLQEELLPLKSQNRHLEAEVGPIKYIAAMIYGDEVTTNLLERAVRWVILIIVAVFDPLAVVMLIAANWSLKNGSRKDDQLDEKMSSSVDPEVKPADHPLDRSDNSNTDSTLDSIIDPTRYNLDNHQDDSFVFARRDIIPQPETDQQSNVQANVQSEVKLDVNENVDVTDELFQELTQAEVEQEIADLLEAKAEQSDDVEPTATDEPIEVTVTEIKPVLEKTKGKSAPFKVRSSKGTMMNISGADESHNTLQNALDDSGDFWRSRPHKPITRG